MNPLLRRPGSRKQVMMLYGVLAVTLAHPVSAQPGSSTTTTNSNEVSCKGLKLMAASGVPGGAEHQYRFHGTCNLLEVYHKTGKAVWVVETDPDNTSKVIETVWVDAAGSWDRNTGEWKERFKVTGQKYQGEIGMLLRCPGDPVIEKPTCVQVQYKNDTGWSGWDRPWLARRALLRGHTTLAEASNLSKQPAPPPAPTPTPFALEAEAQLERVEVTEGRVGRQEMTAFGNEWSQHAQLLWAPGQPGAQLRMLVFLPVAGRYQVFLTHTRAPDYGVVELSVDGRTAGLLGGYSPRVVTHRQLLGRFDFEPGQHELLFTIKARSKESTGYLMGLDRLEFVP